MRCGTVALAGRPDEAFGDPTSGGRCLLGCVIGLASATPRGPRYPLPWKSKFAGGPAERSRGGKAYSFSEAFDRVAL